MSAKPGAYADLDAAYLEEVSIAHHNCITPFTPRGDGTMTRDRFVNRRPDLSAYEGDGPRAPSQPSDTREPRLFKRNSPTSDAAPAPRTPRAELMQRSRERGNAVIKARYAKPSKEAA